MKERPILFSGPMVRAILAGRKTQTRRIMKPQPSADFLPEVGCYHPTLIDRDGEMHPGPERFGAADENEDYPSPYGRPGDRLWVRESGWQPPPVTPRMLREGADTWPAYLYAADGEEEEWCREHGWQWRPSIHMPRWASRITLEITGVRVEPVWNITEADAGAEGAVQWWLESERKPLLASEVNARGAFSQLWKSINGEASWDANPWVWVVEFRRVLPA